MELNVTSKKNNRLCPWRLVENGAAGDIKGRPFLYGFKGRRKLSQSAGNA